MRFRFLEAVKQDSEGGAPPPGPRRDPVAVLDSIAVDVRAALDSPGASAYKAEVLADLKEILRIAEKHTGKKGDDVAESRGPAVIYHDGSGGSGETAEVALLERLREGRRRAKEPAPPPPGDPRMGRYLTGF